MDIDYEVVFMRWLVIGLLVGVCIFEMVIAVYNQKHSRKPVAENVRDVYDEKRYNKWLAYSLEGHRFKHTDASWMISALKTLSRENLVNLNPHPLSVRLYYSHPPINERIGALQ